MPCNLLVWSATTSCKSVESTTLPKHVCAILGKWRPCPINFANCLQRVAVLGDIDATIGEVWHYLGNSGHGIPCPMAHGVTCGRRFVACGMSTAHGMHVLLPWGPRAPPPHGLLSSFSWLCWSLTQGMRQDLGQDRRHAQGPCVMHPRHGLWDPARAGCGPGIYHGMPWYAGRWPGSRNAAGANMCRIVSSSLSVSLSSMSLSLSYRYRVLSCRYRYRIGIVIVIVSYRIVQYRRD